MRELAKTRQTVGWSRIEFTTKNSIGQLDVYKLLHLMDRLWNVASSPHFSPGAVMIAEDFGPVYARARARARDRKHSGDYG